MMCVDDIAVSDKNDIAEQTCARKFKIIISVNKIIIIIKKITFPQTTM